MNRLPSVLNIGALVALLGVFAVGLFADHQNRGAFERRQHSEVLGTVNRVRANLEGLILGDVQLAWGLIAVIATEPEMDQARFTSIARILIGYPNHIRHIAAAPDLVVRMVYPMHGNEAVLGLDYRTHSEQWETARRARDSGNVVMAGPVALLQGGEGLIARIPVWVEEEGSARLRFWGIVAAVIDTERLYRASGLTDAALDLDIALVGRDGQGADGEVFFGDPGVLELDPVTATASLPEGSWMIAAVPRGGWQSRPPMAWLVWAAVFGFGALIVAPLPIAARLATERQRVFAALETRERDLERVSRRLDLALSASRVGVWEYNIDRDELIWDDRMNELYGVPEDQKEHAYRDWRDRVHPADVAAAEAVFAACIGNRGSYDTRFRLLLAGGATRHIRAIGAVNREGDGTSKVVGVNWDVTASVEREAELETKRREAEAASVAKSRFLATMSHEVRTPMFGVLGMLDLLLQSPLDAEQRERVEIARSSAHTLLAILNDILDLSRLEADGLALERAPVDVEGLVAEVAALFRPQAEARGLALAFTLGEALPQQVEADPVRLRQILVNLVSNAIKFTDAGRISIAADYDAAAELLTLAVRDTGIGIPEADRAALFDPFTQLDSALDRRVGGAGLGLSISSQLAALMGGELALQSAEGGGSTFSLRMPAPVAAPRPAPAALPVAQMKRRTAAPGKGGGLDILLVEDNPTNQLIVTAFLARAGHRVVSASNGMEALDALAPGRFDLVLMDVQMPQMDGPTTTTAIRRMGDWARRLPIIALTANAMAGDRERYLAAGMTDYVSKPIDPGALHRALDRAVAASAA